MVPSQVPLIASATDSTTPAVLPSSLAPFATGMTTDVPQLLNKLLTALHLATAYGGNGFGVVSGLELAPTVGLLLGVQAGTAMLGAPVQVEEMDYPLPDDQPLVYVWVKQDGTITHSLTTASPEANALHIGTCTTLDGEITMCDKSGVVYVRTGHLYRETADRGAPKDLPGGIILHTKTEAGVYAWTGSRHEPQGTPVRTANLAADLQLDEADAPVQVLTPTGATRKVRLPSSPDVRQTIRIHNAAAATYDILVRDADDTTTITTLPPGSTSVDFVVVVGGSSPSPRFDASPQTPAFNDQLD